MFPMMQLHDLCRNDWFQSIVLQCKEISRKKSLDDILTNTKTYVVWKIRKGVLLTSQCRSKKNKRVTLTSRIVTNFREGNLPLNDALTESAKHAGFQPDKSTRRFSNDDSRLHRDQRQRCQYNFGNLTLK